MSRNVLKMLCSIQEWNHGFKKERIDHEVIEVDFHVGGGGGWGSLHVDLHVLAARLSLGLLIRSTVTVVL